MAQHVLISSFNCRGLRDKKKRNELFLSLRNNYNGLVLLQETHSVTSDEDIWQKEWGNFIYYCHGTSAKSRGIAIWVPHNFEILVTDVKHDSKGCLLLLDCTIEGNNFIQQYLCPN